MSNLKNILNIFKTKPYSEIMQQFSTENNGNYIVGQYDNQDSIVINYLNYPIKFDKYILYRVVGGQTFEAEFIRVCLEVKTTDELRFKIVRQGLFENCGKLLGGQDIEIGDKDFDNKFLIKGNEEFKIQSILSNEGIIKKLEEL